MNKVKFKVGSGQSFQQAWSAMMVGHFARRADWPTNTAYMYHDEQDCFMMVNFRAVPISADPHCDNLTAADIRSTDWTVMKEAHK